MNHVLVKITYGQVEHPFFIKKDKEKRKFIDFNQMNTFMLSYNHLQDKYKSSIKDIMDEKQKEVEKEKNIEEDTKNENKEDVSIYEIKKRKPFVDKITEFGLSDCKRIAL